MSYKANYLHFPILAIEASQAEVRFRDRGSRARTREVRERWQSGNRAREVRERWQSTGKIDSEENSQIFTSTIEEENRCQKTVHSFLTAVHW